jgi:flotillin
MKQADFNAAVQAKTAEAAQAGPLATATARQRVTEQETRIDQVRKQQEVLVQEQEAARKEKELLATVIRPAEAQRQAAIVQAEGEKQATIIKAEGAKQATVIKAEATQKELEYEGAGEAAKIEKVGLAEAAKVLAIGEAEAEVVKKKLLAEAEGLQRKAEAWKNFNDAAVLNLIVDKMPELAQAFATQLAGIDKINIIDMGGGGNGAGGVGRLMGTVGGGMTAMLGMLKDQFGIDVARLAAAKTDAATTQAEAGGAAQSPAK